MSETVNGIRVTVSIVGSISGTDGAKKDINFQYDKTFGDGTGTDQLGNVWEDTIRTLNTTSEDLDLGTGGLSDFQGAAVVLNNIKLLAFENLDTDTGDYFYLKPGSTNPVTTVLGGTSPTLTIGPGGLCLLINPVDGYAVTDGSADVLAAQAADNSTYHILIGGDNA